MEHQAALRGINPRTEKTVHITFGDRYKPNGELYRLPQIFSRSVCCQSDRPFRCERTKESPCRFERNHGRCIPWSSARGAPSRAPNPAHRIADRVDPISRRGGNARVW